MTIRLQVKNVGCFNEVPALACKATVNALTYSTGVAAEIDLKLELKLYLTGKSATGDFVPPQILLEKSIVKKCRY